jgi:hypothetical protein
MEGIFGAGLLDFYANNFQMAAKVETTYRGFQSDSRLAGNSPAYQAIRAQAGGQLSRYRVLSPLDVAKNAGEAFAIGGGNMGEQGAIADMLDRAEQNLIARNPNLDSADAQRQAVAMLKGLDVANRFFDPKTGQFSTGRANTELDRVQALLAASNGLATGQNFYAFEKSAKLAGQRLSLEGEAEMAHYIEINPSRAGTALSSFENLFGGHASRMAAKDKEYWTKQGIYGKDGRIADSGLFYSNPLEWIAQHMGHINLDDISDRTQRQTVGSLIGETLGATGNINRQAAATARQNVTGNTGNMLGGPGGQMLLFEASMERFRTSLGKFESGPGVKILDGLTSALDGLTAFMTKHPTAATGFLELSAALAGFAVVRGAVVLSGLGGSLSVLGRGMALFAKGAPAAEAAIALPASLSAVAGGLVLLGAALVGLPPLMNLLAHAFGPINTTHPNSANRGHAGALTAVPPSVHTFSNRGNYHPTAFETPAGGGSAMHINLIVDGKKMAGVVTDHQMRAMRPGVQTGTSGPDWLQTPLPVGMSPSLI